MRNNPPVIALTVAGSDPSSGAGIQADLRVFETLGVHGLSALSCTTAQVPGKVVDIKPLSPESLRLQLEVLLDTYQVAAIKTGMLCTVELVQTVMAIMVKKQCAAPLVIDPVIRASSGDILTGNEAVDLYKNSFIAKAALFTPNVDEASVLLGGQAVNSANFEQCAIDLYDRYNTPVLLKGGHLETDDAIDVLVTEKGARHYIAPYIKGVNPHGTGCAYSAAITANIALGHSLEKAVSLGKKYITAAISNCVHIGDGQQMLGHSSLSK